MNKYKVIIEIAAEEDLIGIFDYISNTLLEVETAKNMLTAITEAFEALELFPLRTPVVLKERYKEVNLRRLIVKNYSIIYFVNEAQKTVHIINIVYNRRELNQLFNEL